MGLFSDADMQDFGNLAADLLFKDTCMIARSVDIDDGMGGSTQEWQIQQENVPCAVLDAGNQPSETLQSGRFEGRVIKLINLPRGTDILGEDRIVVGDIAYNVVEPLDPSSYEVIRRVYVVREEGR